MFMNRSKMDLRNCDNMELMAEFPDNYFELAIVDPPYGIDFAKTYTGKGWVVRRECSGNGEGK